MSLSAKVMYTGRWGAVVVPSNDRELAESRTAGESLFLFTICWVANSPFRSW